MTPRMLIAGFLLLSAAPITTAQDAATPASPVPGQLVVAADAVTLTRIAPRALDPDELVKVAGELYGPTLFVGTGEGKGTMNVDHFLRVGDSILIRDTAVRGAAIAAALQQLEREEQMERAQRLAAGRASGGEAGFDDFGAAPMSASARASAMAHLAALPRLEIRPRYLPFKSVVSLLTPFQRYLNQEIADEGDQLLSNVTVLDEANTILVQEEPDRLKQIEALVARADQPLPQVTVSALLLQLAPATVDPRPSEIPGAGGDQIPLDLARELARMLPFTSVTRLATAVVRCTVQPDRICSLNEQNGRVGSWSLDFAPSGLDAERGRIALSNCRFMLTRNSSPTTQGITSQQQLTTDLDLALGEWVVLGAVGADPVAIAVRVEPNSGSAGAAKSASR